MYEQMFYVYVGKETFCGSVHSICERVMRLYMAIILVCEKSKKKIFN